MSLEKTLSIIKPDAVGKNIIGKIIQRFEENNLKIVASKMVHLNKEKAEGFYSVHKDKPFFNDLINYMTSGPVIIQVLQGDNAVEQYRNIMGATNPSNAENGTIRKEFALNIQENSVHGSDSEENANIEINYFFSESEILPN